MPMLFHWTRLARRLALGLAATLALGAVNAHAAQAGLGRLSVKADNGDTTDVALFYPTEAPERAMAMGPFTLSVAMGGTPAASARGLILLSHGTRGSELGHADLAQALARAGYVVAALRHPHDNWQDASMAGTPRYWRERPQQVSRVLDAVLADPTWKDRIPSGHIGALGHSAGGFTVLALAGGAVDLNRLVQHCMAPEDDTLFCGLGAPGSAPQSSDQNARFAAAAKAAPLVVAGDARVRAVMSLAPVGVVFDPASLQAIAIPVALYTAEKDQVLMGRFHGDAIRPLIPGVQAQVVPNAGHFAFMIQPTASLPSDAGNAASNPTGFDRPAFLQGLAQDAVRFFDASLN